MGKLKLSQQEIDQLVLVERVERKSTVCGVGVVDVVFQPSIRGKVIWQYELWKGVLRRCCSEKLKANRPHYREASICTDWLSFATFFEWVNLEVGYKGKPVGMELDKDILVKGNKVYSPTTCCFVPSRINKLLTDRRSHRGQYPIGVTFNKTGGRLAASLNCNGVDVFLGLHDTPEAAFLAYKTAKESYVKEVANEYRHALTSEAYTALMSWEVDISA
jgi:hypothetical protein